MEQISVIKKAAFTAVGFQLKTTFAGNRQASEIPPFFHKTVTEDGLSIVSNRENEEYLCIFDKKADSPDLDYTIAALAEMPRTDQEDLALVFVPESVYACVRFSKKGNQDVLKILKFMMEEWAPENGYSQNHAGKLFIRYDAQFLAAYRAAGYEGETMAELYFPVVKQPLTQ